MLKILHRNIELIKNALRNLEVAQLITTECQLHKVPEPKCFGHILVLVYPSAEFWIQVALDVHPGYKEVTSAFRSENT